MKCEFEFCIYNDECACTVEGVAINGMGMCDSCLLPSIPKEELAVYKADEINKYEKN